MALKVRRAGAADYGRYVKALVVGDPGAGKTRSASTWPNVLFANIEGGMMSVTDRQSAVIDISGSVELTELLRTLEQAAPVREKILGVPVETVCIDTIDQFARILVEERLSDQRKEAMAIQDWGWLGDQLRGVVRGFRNLPMHVIFNCHVKSQEDSDSGKVTYRPAIQGAMGDEIPSYVDLAVLLTARPRTVVKNGQNIRELARVMQTFPDAQHPWIKDRSGKLPMEFGINLDDDFKRMDALVFVDMPAEGAAVHGDPSAAPTPPVTAPEAKAAPTKAAAKKAAAGTLPVDTAPEPAAAPETEAEAPPAAEVATDAVEAPAGEAEPDAAEGDAAPAADAETRSSDPAPEPEQQAEATPESAVAPAPEADPQAEAEPTADAEQQTLAEESVPQAGTEAAAPAEETKPAWQICASCGGDVESKDQADLSFIRFREHLCRSCFAARKKAK